MWGKHLIPSVWHGGGDMGFVVAGPGQPAVIESTMHSSILKANVRSCPTVEAGL